MKRKTKKVGIITQARYSSTRLPGKVMLLIKNRPLIDYHIERLRKSGLPIYIASSTNRADDVIENYAKERGIDIFRGNEEDVLARFFDCCRVFNLDIIIRVTSDCPLIDGDLIREAYENYRRMNSEDIHYSCNIKRTYPHGLNFEIFSSKLLYDAYLNANTPFFREHVTPYIIQNIPGYVSLHHFIRNDDASHYRITVDTQSDFDLIKLLIEEHSAHKMSAERIIDLLEHHPELVSINKGQTHVWGDGTKIN